MGAAEKIDECIDVEAFLENVRRKDEEVLEKIKEALDGREINYSCGPKNPGILDMTFCTDNKPFRIVVSNRNKRICYKVFFPCRVQCNALALMALNMIERNYSKVFTMLNLDIRDGEMTLDYNYVLRTDEYFDEDFFFKFFDMMLEVAQDVYAEINHLSVGMVSEKKRDLYAALLQQALDTINGKSPEADEVVYGCMNILNPKEEKHGFLERFLKEARSGELADIFRDDGELPQEEDSWLLPDFVDSSDRDTPFDADDAIDLKESFRAISDILKETEREKPSGDRISFPFVDTEAWDGANASDISAGNTDIPAEVPPKNVKEEE